MEKLKLNKENFDNILALLNSPDQESVVLGMSCIEETELENCITYLLLLRKLANVTEEIWKQHAPEKQKFIKNLDVFNGIITYKSILDCICNKKVSMIDLQFFMDKFSEHLFKQLPDNITSQIDELQIKIKLKLKYHEPEISGQSGQGIQELNA